MNYAGFWKASQYDSFYMTSFSSCSEGKTQTTTSDLITYKPLAHITIKTTRGKIKPMGYESIRGFWLCYFHALCDANNVESINDLIRSHSDASRRGLFIAQNAAWTANSEMTVTSDSVDRW